MGFLKSMLDSIIKNQEVKEEYYQQSGENFFTSLFFTGASGEFRTYKKLAKIPGDNKFIANCYIPKEDGTSSEIDLILIHETGIYVLESKNYSGYIFGAQEQKMWTQTLHAGRGRVEKHRFYNPIWQNKTHIRHLKKYLGLEIPFYSYIVFSDRCSFKSLEINADERVLHRSSLIRWLTQDIDSRSAVLDKSEIETIYKKIKTLSYKSNDEKRVHVQNIKTEKMKVEEKIRKNICPRCGGQLVLRTAKTGPNIGSKFYGCSNYPKCKFTTK